MIFVVLDVDSALVLAEEFDDEIFARLGVVEFKDKETMERYIEGCEEKTFVGQ